MRVIKVEFFTDCGNIPMLGGSIMDIQGLNKINFPKAIWSFFSSVRLSIYLVLIFVLIAFIGSFVMQGNPLFEGMNHEILFKWLGSHGAENIGKLWWLYALIIITFILTINTIVCNINRFSSLIKYRQRLLKRKWIEFSSYLMHLGFLTVLAGHLISSSTGFISKGNVLYEAAPFKAPNMDYYVRLDNLKADYYEGGYLKSVESNLTVIENEKEVLNKKVEVNQPLSYKGVYFYQVDFGEIVSGANLLLGSGSEGKLYSLGFGERLNLSEKGYMLELGRLMPDFDITANGEAYSKSERFNNPAVELILYKNEKLISKTWAFYRDFKREPFSGTKIKAILIGFPTKKYAIMDIHKDKGAAIVLVGSLLFISAFLSYFIQRKMYKNDD